MLKDLVGAVYADRFCVVMWWTNLYKYARYYLAHSQLLSFITIFANVTKRAQHNARIL